MKKNISLLTLFIMSIFSAFSQAPKTLSYQGNISDSSMLLNGTYAMTFRIYNAATGGGALWSETTTAVPISNGIFSIILGKIVPVNIETNTSLWMGITLGGNPEISPRVELTGSLYTLGMALPYRNQSSSPTSLFSIEATADGARAGEFTHSGVNSGQAALLATSTGGNLAFQAWNSGSNERSASFYSSSPTSPAPNVGMMSLGLGKGLDLSLTNTSNSSAALFINHAGTGNALTANRPIQATQFIGDGSLLTGLQGLSLPFSQSTASPSTAFEITNSSTSGSAARFNISNITNTASGIHVQNLGAGTGIYVQTFNSANTLPAFESRTTGIGYAGLFTVANPESRIGSAIRVVNGGLGGGGYFETNNPLGTGSPIVGQVSQGTGDVINASQLGTGSGLFVNILNAANSAPGIKINHSGTGNAITANRPIQATDITATGNLNARGLIYTWPAAQTNGVLTNNGSGGLTWAPGSSGWGLTGSAGTVDGTNFIGTIDNVPLNIKVNNQKSGRIDHVNYNVFLGYQSGFSITTGASNTGIGHRSLNANTTGAGNNAIGRLALEGNTTGIANNALGNAALNLNTTGHENTGLGNGALSNNTVGNGNVSIGSGSLATSIAGSYAVAIGNNAMQLANNTSAPFNNQNIAIGFEAFRGSTTVSANTGNSNIALGFRSLRANSSGTQNTAIGMETLTVNTTGNNSTAVGAYTLYQNDIGYGNSAFGAYSLFSNTLGSGNTSIGHNAIRANTNGGVNSALGNQSLYLNTTGNNNTGVGGSSLYSNTTGSNNTALGYNANVSTGTLNNATVIGYNALVSASNSLVLGGTGANAVKVGIGVTAPAAFLDVAGNVKITDGTQGLGKVLTSDANGLATWAPAGGGGWSLTGSSGTIDGTNFIGTTDNIPLNFKVNNQKAGRIDPTGSVFLGYQAGNSNTSRYSTGVGYQALFLNTSADGNTANGYNALYSNTTGNSNTANGFQALFLNTSGSQNTGNGSSALLSNTIGQNNTASGLNALYSNTTGNDNTANGVRALFSNTTGLQNTANGNLALNINSTGYNNTALGYNANVSIGNLTNATAIGANAMVSSSNSLVLGGTGTDAVKVGIGVTAPTAFLDVAGNVKITDGTQGLGKVLTSDANGLATWAPAGGGGWSLTGSTGTIDGTNFIGTTDNIPLNFKVNNQKAGRIDPTGPVFLGYQAGNNNTTLNSTGVGYQALFSNTTGYNNTANGHHALFSNTTGTNNTANGSAALIFNTTGYNNTANGYHALYSNTVGRYNTANGGGALSSNTTGSENTANGSLALSSNTTGFNNTANGGGALAANTIGTFNTAVGFNAFISGVSFTNSTAIGYNAQVTASNMIRLGDANVTSINGAVAFTVVSDGRFKKDIRESVSGLPFIMKLRPVTYHFDMDKMAHFMKTPDSLRSEESELLKERVLQTGFIAQEVERAAQELGYDFSGIDKPANEDDYYGLRYAEFTVPLVKAVQEQQEMIAELQSKIKRLEEQADIKQSALGKLETENSMLKSDYSNRLVKLEEALGIKAQK